MFAFREIKVWAGADRGCGGEYRYAYEGFRFFQNATRLLLSIGSAIVRLASQNDAL
jgi:hypothetical protein